MSRARILALFLVALLLPLGAAQVSLPGTTTTSGSSGGVLVKFPVTRYNDTLFAAASTAYRAAFDDAGDVWYTTQAGLVHLAIDQRSREIFTHQEGLPSSLSLGLAIKGAKVYVGTDLGMAVVDRLTGNVTPMTPANSPLPDYIVHEIAVDGDQVWIGTHFQGVAIWNLTSGSWTEKNTSTTSGYAKPVRRITPQPDAIWVATEGDGAWRMDRATGEWTHVLASDGLPSNSVYGIRERGRNVYFGTDKGLVRWAHYAPYAGTSDEWLLYNATRANMPSDRVQDVDLIPTDDGTLDLFVATEAGLWQLDPESGNSTTRTQEFGILGTIMFDETFSPTHGWVFATSRGISLLRDGNWTYYASGQSLGRSSAPLNYRFTAAYADDASPFVWIGAPDGLAAFEPASGDKLGAWYNLGEWLKYPGGLVNVVKTQGNTTWLGTSTGVWGYDIEADQWIQRTVGGAVRNLVYGVDTTPTELWIGLFGDGLIMENLTSGATRSWTFTTPTPIPDQAITDVRIQGDDVWLGCAIGAIRMDRVAGTFKGTYTGADGIPGDGVVFRTLPDGNDVYLGTQNGGIARLDVKQGKVTRVWNSTNVPGYADGEVRALLKTGSTLWAGTKSGLVEIDLATGNARAFNQSGSKLVQDFVSGIAEKDGLLYLATSSGVARFDPATSEFLPMRDGPTTQRGAGSQPGRSVRSPLSVRIESPHDGVGVTGTVEIKGSSNKLGGVVDKVEVRIGAGPWQPATGTAPWTLLWDTSGSPANEPLVIGARAVSGPNVSKEADVTVTPVALPTIPFVVEHAPVATGFANRALLVGAKITGDEPLSATLYYKVNGRDVYAALPMARQGALFTASVPAKDVQLGDLPYYIVAKSGLLERSTPDDPTVPNVAKIGPPPRVAVSIQGPADASAKAGLSTSLPLNVTNVGTDAATYALFASGLRASWVRLPGASVTLGPGETREVVATLDVPLRAFADNTTLTFEVRDTAGVAEPARADVPVRVLEDAGASAPAPAKSGSNWLPAPGLAPALALALALALVLRRSRR